MAAEREIRANFDRDSIVVYQAYSDAIANAALKHQRFMAPFSFRRMTWIKPSFLWLMHRSRWGNRSGQERTLAIRMTREGWNHALSMGILTHPEPEVFSNPDEWRRKFQAADVHIQWDTERSIRGAGRNHYSIQVGIGRGLIQNYVEDWITEIVDLSGTVSKISRLLKAGQRRQAEKQLPTEQRYEVDQTTAANIWLS